ncbi:MAG TPA: glycoside hydrolase family 88 protein [Candidatus Binataceae bacterium]|nr:glycoside hydrolase family 88 protein [Candidatus Binataceae bacterium]
MNKDDARRSLARLAGHASRELLTKQPHWGDAILCDGLLAAAEALNDDAPAKAVERWFAPKLAAGPALAGWFWFWAAEALPALNLHLRTGRGEYLDYARAIVDAFETRATRTRDGAIVPHPPALEVWVDVSHFTAPAMALLGRLTADAPLIERALDQLIVHWRNLADPATDLLWHVAYAEKNTHSPCLWARGNSWFSIAAPMVISIVESEGYHDRYREKTDLVQRALVRQLCAVIALQDPSGLWHTVIDRPDSYLETSAAAGFADALGMAVTARYAGLDIERARAAHESALAAIAAKINDAGEFTGVSQQTPPGDFAFYNSIEVGAAPFGTGLCLSALSHALAPDRGGHQ